MKYSSEELNERFQTLPEELKNAIVSVDTAKIISEAGKRYALHIDQIGKIAEEVGFVLLGLSHPTEFVSKLTKALGIERVVVSQIASDINDKIFLKVRETLRGVDSGLNKKEESMDDSGPTPLKDALLQAIENPESITKKPIPAKPESIPLVEIKNPHTPTTPENKIPAVAPIPTTSTEQAPTPSLSQTTTSQPTKSIIDQKLGGQFSIPKTEKRVDPYRESF